MQAGGLAAVLGATGLAGCSGIIGGGGSSTATASNWQYDPAELTPSPNVVFGAMDYGQFYEIRDQLPESMRQDFEFNQTQGDSPVTPSDIDHMIAVGGGRLQLPSNSAPQGSFSMLGSFAVTGSFDKGAIVDQASSEGQISRSGDYEGYAMFEVSDLGQTPMGGISQQYDGSATMGVGESALVAGLSLTQGGEVQATGTDAAETMIDASAGNAPRISARSGPIRNAQRRVNDRMLSAGVQVDPELVSFVQDRYGMMLGQASGMLTGLRSGGFGADVDPDTTTYHFALVYESDSAASDSGIVQLMSDSTSEYEQREGIDSVSVSQDGAAIVAEISGDTKTLLEQGGPTGTLALDPPAPGSP